MSEAPLIGEPLALDLVNTRPADDDLLSTPDQLAEWLRSQADRLPERGPAHPTADDLDQVRRIRTHLTAVFEALLHDRRPPAAALRGLNNAQSAAPAIRHLEWTGNTLTADARRPGSAGARLAAALAESAAELLADPSITRLKQCEAQDCVLLFLPAHPRRRWCSAQRCGNRVRVARYYDRHKKASNPGTATG
ncbi:CGNR zinc finger domain-containing protein [Nocardia sp. NBC_01329]|uniref:CGNR zinc finger domain-containing protein n=1 Tax=Nocardia sp. NBC_01329 TaxID=2903594 RepID=UPI002E13CC40|nr:CGNR zinc finger domain-containing protein [Nocardia sp. NBC_01329]